MSRITVAIVGALFFSPLASFAEDAQALQEIRELKQLMEQQMKRIDELTVEVGRMHQAVEALTPGSAPKREVGAPAPFSGYTDILKPTVAKAEPVAAKEEPKAETPAGVKHLVEKGETLTAIAKRYNVTLPDLLKANKGVNDRKMQIGQTLTIPIIAAPDGAKPSEPAKIPETPTSEKKENP